MTKHQLVNEIAELGHYYKVPKLLNINILNYPDNMRQLQSDIRKSLTIKSFKELIEIKDAVM